MANSWAVILHFIVRCSTNTSNLLRASGMAGVTTAFLVIAFHTGDENISLLDVVDDGMMDDDDDDDKEVVEEEVLLADPLR